MMTTSTKDDTIDNLDVLIALKSSIEDEVESQIAILRKNSSTLDSPLIDGDGFPRADIDVWAVRHARVKIIRLRNDLSSLMDRIAIALEHFHASQPAGGETDTEIPLRSLLPFAKVDAVAPGSPAQSSVSSHLVQLPFDFNNLFKGIASWRSHREIRFTDSGERQWLPPIYCTTGGTQ